ncbi:WUSCHEL-related homeobox 9-like [Bidens hawaiensis]|uniref:WUSCHEL-related homeobox 9-like n=1 Tax=Bidens hawaiensis TaxID=980011 RepID=UPI00404B3669
MASSNRHWPSMFKSKPTCNTRHHHQWHSNDSNNLLSSASACHRSPYSSGCEERSPEPKPRWNPKPEQIRILESIFNSGMVNPPREEIRKIRAQLQEYGQVGDANVFYWFQNRKSRSKHKSRQLQKPQNHQSPATTTTKTTTPSSSSSSEKSYSKSIDFLLNSPTASVNQNFSGGVSGGYGNTGYRNHQLTEFSAEQSFCFPTVHQPPPPTTSTSASFTQGFSFTEFGNNDEAVGSGSGSEMLLTDLLMMNQQSVRKMNNNKGVEEKCVKVSSYNFTPPLPAATTTSVVPSNPTTTNVPSTLGEIQGVVEPMPAGKSTVFINDVAFEVALGPFNVREAFGDDAVLIHSYGQPVVTNEWGVTLQSLQHGAFYYLVRPFSYGQSSTIDLVHMFLPFVS